MEGSTANTVLLMTAPAELWNDWMARLAKSYHASSNMLRKIKHASIDLGITVELCPNSLQDETSVNRERFERALYHLERVGTLMNGHGGLDLGVNACVQTTHLG